jgi:Rhodopirellula transposase DDE domain
LGKAIPYGIYNLIHKSGFMNVSIDHETAEFSVESIRCWWQTCGKALYLGQTELLITADGGGSNGVKNRLWKKKLQELANEKRLTITVLHYPSATSKWNKIEHRFFAFLSINWRATPSPRLKSCLN